MNSDLLDGVPEPIAFDERSKRKTSEFCCQIREGHRCMRLKGHDGPHEAFEMAGALRW